MLSVLPFTALLISLTVLQTQQTTQAHEDNVHAAQAQVEPDAPLHISDNVQPPVVTHRVDPKFSREARREKLGGDVQVYLWVDKQGLPSHVRVTKSAGMGLDEKAVEAVRKYRFKPATLNGEPVVVDLYIDINFQIFPDK